jgi:hypothetical protein
MPYVSRLSDSVHACLHMVQDTSAPPTPRNGASSGAAAQPTSPAMPAQDAQGPQVSCQRVM